MFSTISSIEIRRMNQYGMDANNFIDHFWYLLPFCFTRTHGVESLNKEYIVIESRHLVAIYAKTGWVFT